MAAARTLKKRDTGQGDWPLGDSRMENFTTLLPYRHSTRFKIYDDVISLQFKPWICPSRA